SVDEFSVDGQARPPLLTDSTRWQRAIFQSPGSLTIQPMSGPNQGFRLDLNMENKTLSLGKRDDPDWKADFTFDESEPGSITLEGELEGHRTYAKLIRVDESKFLLKSRGFHWVQEYPFNR
ncbi:MAG TPA: DoxX family protein, partial [Blastocatellia bacterium]